MTDNRFAFTKASLAALPLPKGGKRASYYDTREPGLMLSVTAKGARSFYLYKRIDGRPERVFLGRFPDLSVENARKACAEAKGKIAVGRNPQRERSKLRQEITLGELVDKYLVDYAIPRKKTWAQDRDDFNRVLSHWFGRRLSSFDRSEFAALHTRLGRESGRYQANRMLSRISALFNKAIEWGWEGSNPAKGTKPFPEKARDRFLLPDEIPRFFEALAAEPSEIARDFFMMALLTGQRRSNVMAMRWDELDSERGLWRIADTKNNEPMTVPLSAQALEILARRRDGADGSEWVFPGSGKTGHLVEPKKAWRRILDRAGLENLRIHDLRRTLGSWQAAAGANSYIIGKSLGHKSPQATAIYARLHIDPVRDSVNRATDAMFATLNPAPDEQG